MTGNDARECIASAKHFPTPKQCGWFACCMLLRAVPVVTTAALLLFRRGGHAGAAEQQAQAPALRPPRRLLRRVPPGTLGVRPGRVRKAAVFSTLSVLLCYALGYAALHGKPALVLCYLAAANAACSLVAAGLCFGAVTKKPAGREVVAQRGVVSVVQLSPLQIAALGSSYSGFWRKDCEASDSMNEAMDLIQLNWLIRAAVNVITGLELQLTADQFLFVVKSRLKLNVREVYPTNGEGRRHMRRDMRGGGALGRCTVTPAGISLVLSWEDPRAGTEDMLFTLSDGNNTLTVRSVVTLRSGPSCVYNTVYRR